MLNVGFVDFETPALLITGDAKSFGWLAEKFAQGADFAFSDFPGEVRQHGVDVRIARRAAGGMSKAANRFDWAVSAEEAARYVVQLRVLAEPGQSGHHYLEYSESSDADFDVIASVGEYTPDVFARRD